MGGRVGGEWDGKAEVGRTCHRSKLLVRTGTFPAASSWEDSSPSSFEGEFRAGGRELDRTCVTEQCDKGVAGRHLRSPVASRQSPVNHNGKSNRGLRGERVSVEKTHPAKIRPDGPPGVAEDLLAWKEFTTIAVASAVIPG